MNISKRGVGMTRIYLAGPLFSAAEQEFNRNLRDSLVEAGFQVDLPQESTAGLPALEDIYQRCIQGVEHSDLVLAGVDGADADSGTAYEMGYARARGKPILAFRTDFRQSGDAGGVNLMLKFGATKYIEVGLEGAVDSIVQAVKEYVKAE